MKRTFSILFALAMALSLSLVAATPVMAQSWLTGWSHRVEITIDSGKIDEALAGFPVLLYLSTSSGINGGNVSCVFDELGAEKLKLAVTKDDGTTQCYVEIEEWDSANRQAWLWVKVPNIATGANTTLYLYYDSTQPDNTTWVGETGSTPAQNVWDNNFVGVWHKTDGPAQAILDSTSYANNGTKKGNNEPQQVDGQIAKAQDYDGTDDFVTLPNIDLHSAHTLECWLVRYGTQYGLFIAQRGAGGNAFQFYDRPSVTDNKLHYWNGTSIVDSDSDVSTGTWHYAAVTHNGTNALVFYLNGATDGSRTLSLGGESTENITLQLNTVRYAEGVVDEVRISDIARSAAWIKATYHSGDDSLLSYGSEESPPPPGPPSRPVPKVYDLIISSTGGGNVTTPGEGLFPYSERRVVKLVASPDAGYKFVNWTGDVDTVEDVNAATTKITMNGDYSINATFATEEDPPGEPLVQYELTVSSTMGGSVTTPGEGTFPYDAGMVVSLEASPDFGYKFVNWTGGITHADSATTTVTMNGDYTVMANFEFEQTTTDSTGGSLGPLACFIATAAYGTPTAEQLDVLREFRDAVLLESAAGSQFVALYYQLSPPIADFIAGNELLRTLVKELLVDPVVWVVEATGDMWRN
jgi:hypothetical protein